MKPAGSLVLSLGISLLALTCNRLPEGKDRSYTNAVPGFSIAYPDRWQPEKPRYDHEVFRATDPSALPSLAIDTYEPSEPIGIDDQYSDKFMKYLKFLFPRASDFKLPGSVSVSPGRPSVAARGSRRCRAAPISG